MSATLPPPLACWFDAQTLCAQASTLVALDDAGTILWTNRAWHEFAEANGSPTVATSFGVGTSYFDGISGELRGYFQDAFADALHTRRAYQQDYECSSPEVRRHLHLRALPIASSCLLLEHSLVCAAPHDGQAHAATDAMYLSSSGVFVQCSNCRRMRRADAPHWDWVPAWVLHPPPPTSHGLCDICLGVYLSTARSGPRLTRSGEPGGTG